MSLALKSTRGSRRALGDIVPNAVPLGRLIAATGRLHDWLIQVASARQRVGTVARAD